MDNVDSRTGVAIAPLSERESLTAIVYGDTFALYDEAAFDEFVRPLYERLRANAIDTDVFRGKRCLDAGCGGGRGSVLMAQCGAREVIGVDLSPVNIESARKRARQKGLDQVRFEQARLSSIPFTDESFDIVWCNGVLHHMEDPDKGLLEVSRVLKTGGWLWLYLYGSGGTYWYVIDWIRHELRDVAVRDCIVQLRLMEAPVRRIAEWIDDWFVAHLRRYTAADVTARLTDLGFDQAEPLGFGVGYDTSHRRSGAGSLERVHMGEGDLRFFSQKRKAVSGTSAALPDPPDGKGSLFADGATVTRFAQPLGDVSRALAALESRSGRPQPAIRIMACRAIHSRVRGLLESSEPFDAEALEIQMRTVTSLIDELDRAVGSDSRLRQP